MCIRFIHNVQIPFLLEVLCRYVILEYIQHNILHVIIALSMISFCTFMVCTDKNKNKHWYQYRWIEHYLQGILYYYGYHTLLPVCIRELCVTMYETYTYIWY
jgi:hypothetical protein